MIPLPTQLTGAKFLSERKYALLADEPRVGKTGAAILAADDILAGLVLVITTASGRAVWKRAWPEWSPYARKVQVLTPKDKFDEANVTIVGWPSIADPKLLVQLIRQEWGLVILDESHHAKNPTAKRTQAAYRIAEKAKRVWCLTGTPIPNAPNDLWPMLHHLAPERIDNLSYDGFMHRYCIVRMKKLSNFNRIPVVIGGKNLPDLKKRLEGFVLKRTQKDVGIREPIYETFPLIVSEKVRKDIYLNVPSAEILKAAEAGNTRMLEHHLGALRRVTGEIKAQAVVEALKEEFDCGLDKIVLMHWHTEVGHILRHGLAKYGVTYIDGSSTPREREAATFNFSFRSPKARIFIGQIAAAGEAIDLSAASEMLFVETSFVPAQMKQASLRITNYAQKGLVRVRVAVLEGSIDEALESILLRKWSSIREVMT